MPILLDLPPEIRVMIFKPLVVSSTGCLQPISGQLSLNSTAFSNSWWRSDRYRPVVDFSSTVPRARKKKDSVICEESLFALSLVS
jgi:hypothetical protein